MVKITSAYHVISLFVFFLHIAQKHFELSISLRGIGSVRRQVRVEDHELFAVIRIDPRDAVASVKIEDLLESGRDRKTPSKRGSYMKLRLGQKARIGCSVRLGDRIHQIRRVIVLCEHIVIAALPGENPVDQVSLLHMKTSCRVGIDLLKKGDIGIE